MSTATKQTTRQVAGNKIRLGDKVHTGWQGGGYVVYFKDMPLQAREATLDTGEIITLHFHFNYSIDTVSQV